MKLNEIPYVIVQAGGRGTRLEHLAANKPKCLLSVDGEPLLYRLFRQIPEARFVIIADHLADVLEAYLKTVPPQVEHEVVRAKGEGTLSGLAAALDFVDDATPFLVVWCDLFFDEVPSAELGDELLVGLSQDVRCRWSVDGEGALQEVPSGERGVLGLFAVPTKAHLGELPAEGELVRHLARSVVTFATVVIKGVRELGTLAAWEEHHRDGYAARYFNTVAIGDNEVVKTARVQDYGHLLEAEARWYERVHELGFPHAPSLHRRAPLTIERIKGVHPFQLDVEPAGQAAILTAIMNGLDELHGLAVAPPDPESDRIVYREKTAQRLATVRRLLPNIDRPSFVVNGRRCRNPLHPRHAHWFAETVDRLPAIDHALIHGDPTFSNTLVDAAGGIWFIDPRGTFGRGQCFGDPRYDWAKLLYSVAGEYDQFNRRNFRLRVTADIVDLEIAPNGWAQHSPLVRERVVGALADVDVIHALIWLSLTGYAIDDVDSVIGAFYRGASLLDEVA